MEGNLTAETATPTIESFKDAADELVSEGDALMAANHDPGGLDPKEYHTSEHPKILQPWAAAIVNVFNPSPEQRELIRIGISWHDTIIIYDSPQPDNILGTIRRHRGAREGDQPSGTAGNEAQSARKVVQQAQSINMRAGKPLISDDQIRAIVWEIDATYPGVDLGEDFQGATFTDYPFYQQIIEQNPKVGTIIERLGESGIIKGPLFFQPHLEEPLEQGAHVPPEVLAVGLSDLGTPGMAAEPKEFFDAGDAEFRELHTNIRREVQTPDREKVAREIISWLGSQTGFATWQMLRFEKIIYLLKANGQLSGEMEKGLRNLFSHFERNIEATLKRSDATQSEYNRRLQDEKAAFGYITGEIGYSLA